MYLTNNIFVSNCPKSYKYLEKIIVVLLVTLWNPNLNQANITDLSTKTSQPMNDSYILSDRIPPYDPGINLRQYKFEDFLWSGSGDGPFPSEQDGGLAWEDNSGHLDGTELTDIVFITKTMTILKTVMTTVYPVELTPSIIVSTPILTLTPVINDSPSVPYSSSFPSEFDNSGSWIIEPTPTPSDPTMISVTPQPDLTTTPTNFFNTSTTSEISKTSVDDPKFLVNTVIKANASQVLLNYNKFQKEMQKNLAGVYASAFKRHLLNSLGVLHENSTGFINRTDSKSRRRKRNSQNIFSDRQDFQLQFLKESMNQSQLNSLTTAAMNVEVSIVNVTFDEIPERVKLLHVVYAEGKPVLATKAAKDVNSHVPKSEMKSKIGYDVIIKAEALVEDLPSSGRITEGNTSPWLAVAITTMSLMLIVLALLIYFVWKWKHNRLNDTRILARAQSGIEEGVTNPAFLGSSGYIGPDRHRGKMTEKSKPKMSTRIEKIRGREGHSSVHQTREREGRQRSLASDLTSVLDGSGEEMQEKSGTPSVLDDIERSFRGRHGSRRKTTVLSSPVKTLAEEHPERSKPKPTARRKRFETGTEHFELEKQQRKEGKSGVEDEANFGDEGRRRPVSASSRDKLTYGHLDICQDTVAKPMSDEAKKFLGNSKRKEKDKKLVSDSTTTDQLQLEENRFPEMGNEKELRRSEDDRLNQNKEDKIDDTNTQDAQVQTPTRMKVGLKTKKKPKPKPRRMMSPTSSSKPTKPKSAEHSSESLLSTESEEIFEIRRLDDTSSESNPLGKMRKRFHQFLDDAFNVIGKKEENEETERSKSAKVLISHQIETKEKSRPWTSHIIHEETVEETRPGSSKAGPKVKRAWTASTERRCNSARSDGSSGTRSGRKTSTRIPEEKEFEVNDEPDHSSSELTQSVSTTEGNRSSLFTSIAPVFPRYPIYSDIPYPSVEDVQNLPGHTSQLQTQTSLRPSDPAVPLIRAIKEEIKRFENVKVKDQNFHRRST